MSTDEISDYIRTQIFAACGRPKNFSMMKLTKVSDHCYRANLYIKDPGTIMDIPKIEDSYFITIDDDNNIVDSEPPLSRHL
jgi:hypothetical protein